MNKALLLNLILCFTLTACGGGGGGSDNAADNGDGKDIVSDFTPDDFFFLEAANHELSAEVPSNEITLSGLSLDTPISIENGSYSINGATPITEASTVTSGDTVKVFLTTSAEYQTTTTATLSVGTLAVDFTATTRSKDTTPDEFVFTPVVNAGLNSEIPSNQITLSGIDNNTAISITNGSFSINSGEFVTAAQVESGDTLSVQVLSSGEYEAQSQAVVTVGTATFIFSVTTRSIDITPNDFEFTQVENSELSISHTSNTITLSGLETEVDITLTNGMYSVNGAEFTSEAGKVKQGDTLSIRLTSAEKFATLATATVTVGDFTASYNVTTREKDITPDTFEFTAITNAELNNELVSNTVTISGIDDNTPFLFLGSKYTLNGVEFTGGSEVVGGTISNGDELTAFLMTGSEHGNLYIGGFQIGTEDNEFLFQVTTKADVAPTVSFVKELAEDGSTTLTGREELVLTFSEIMQIDTLNLSGDMVPDCNDLADETSCLNLVWSEEDTVLTMSPKEDFYWYADVRSLQVAITGDGTLGLDETISATVLPVFETFQAADVVIGQDDFESTGENVGSNKLGYSKGVNVYQLDGQSALLIADSSNNRIVKYNTIPTENGAAHDERFGQDSESTNVDGNADSGLNNPRTAIELNDRVYISDQRNDRATWVAADKFDVNGEILDSGKASSLVGQEDFGNGIEDQCTQSSLSNPSAMEVIETESGVQWLVADDYNHRVMIWSNPDETKGNNASIVLGQEDFDDCSNNSASVTGIKSLKAPEGIWSNGEKLVVSGSSNHRLLVWNTFPTENNQPADFQLGQESDQASDRNAGQETANQRGLFNPFGIGGNKHQLCVADRNNHRVLIWNTLPDSSDDLANIVIGQSDFTKGAANDLDQDGEFNSGDINGRVLSYPFTCDMSMEQLFIADSANHRVLVFNALNKRPTNN